MAGESISSTVIPGLDDDDSLFLTSAELGGCSLEKLSEFVYGDTVLPLAEVPPINFDTSEGDLLSIAPDDTNNLFCKHYSHEPVRDEMLVPLLQPQVRDAVPIDAHDAILPNINPSLPCSPEVKRGRRPSMLQRAQSQPPEGAKPPLASNQTSVSKKRKAPPSNLKHVRSRTHPYSPVPRHASPLSRVQGSPLRNRRTDPPNSIPLEFIPDMAQQQQSPLLFPRPQRQFQLPQLPEVNEIIAHTEAEHWRFTHMNSHTTVTIGMLSYVDRLMTECAAMREFIRTGFGDASEVLSQEAHRRHAELEHQRLTARNRNSTTTELDEPLQILARLCTDGEPALFAGVPSTGRQIRGLDPDNGITTLLELYDIPYRPDMFLHEKKALYLRFLGASRALMYRVLD